VSEIASESAAPHAAAAVAPDARQLPPVTELAVATLIVIVAGGIYLASNIPAKVSLAPAIALLCAGAALLVANVALLSRVRTFAWTRFWTVFRWVLLAYVVIAGMLEYVFVYDGVRGGTLVVLSGMLVVFALDVPLVISFTVASYADAD
jgi:hypothetical protein